MTAITGRHIIRFAAMALLFVLTSLTAMAQRSYDPHLWVGVHGGSTFANVQFAPSVKQKMLQGVTMGVSVRYAEEKLFGLIAEINLTQRGWAEDFEDAPFSYQRRLTYIQVPFLTHIYFGNKRVQGFVNLGPSVSYMIAHSTNANFDYTNPQKVEGFPLENRSLEQLNMDIKNRVDYGISAGAGFELMFGRHSFYLEGRYYFGLGNIFPAAKKDVFSASRGTAIEVTIGYYLSLKRNLRRR